MDGLFMRHGNKGMLCGNSVTQCLKCAETKLMSQQVVFKYTLIFKYNLFPLEKAANGSKKGGVCLKAIIQAHGFNPRM